MAYQRHRNPFNPLLVGAIAVIVALVVFLVFRESTDTSQQAGVQTPPTTTAPAPSAGPAGPPTSTPVPKGSGNL